MIATGTPQFLSEDQIKSILPSLPEICQTNSPASKSLETIDAVATQSLKASRVPNGYKSRREFISYLVQLVSENPENLGSILSYKENSLSIEEAVKLRDAVLKAQSSPNKTPKAKKARKPKGSTDSVSVQEVKTGSRSPAAERTLDDASRDIDRTRANREAFDAETLQRAKELASRWMPVIKQRSLAASFFATMKSVLGEIQNSFSLFNRKVERMSIPDFRSL